MLEVTVFKYLPRVGTAEISERASFHRNTLSSVIPETLYLYEEADPIIEPVAGNLELIAKLPHDLNEISYDRISAYLAPKRWENEPDKIRRVGSTIVAMTNRYLSHLEGSPLMPYLPKFYLPKDPPLSVR